MNGSPPGSPVFQLMGALLAVQARLEAALEPIGLSIAKFGVLAKLVTAGEPLPLGTLAERCACVKSNITQLVDRLEAERLVVRAADPRDRRSTRAELSAKGRRLYEEGLKAVEVAEQEVLGSLSAPERDELLRLLQGLREGR
jgi:DNA-binding MarR family transcriptional regulator